MSDAELLDPYEPGIGSAEMARRYHLSNGAWIHTDELGRQVRVRHSRFHGAILNLDSESGAIYIGDAALEMARKLLEGSQWEIVPKGQTSDPANRSDSATG